MSAKDFQYLGAFRLASRKYGESDLNFSEGPIALNPDRQSLFIVGHAHQQAIAEFAIPELVDSTVLAELNMADGPIQPFATILDRASGGNPQGNNRIGGMLYVPGPDGPELLVNAYEYYDAPGDNTLSMLVVRDVNDLVRVRAGAMKPHDVRPYEYGIFPTPFEGETHKLGGGAFDASTGRIYLTAQKADRQQGRYANPPVVMAYMARSLP